MSSVEELGLPTWCCAIKGDAMQCNQEALLFFDAPGLYLARFVFLLMFRSGRTIYLSMVKDNSVGVGATRTYTVAVNCEGTTHARDRSKRTWDWA